MARRPLHIGIDGRELLGRPTGVGRYLVRVLDEWSARPGWPHRLTIFVPAEARPDIAHGLTATWTVLPAAHAGTWWEQTTLRAAIGRSDVDVLFAPGYTAPVWLGRPTVVAIHDVSFFAQPERLGWREGLRRRWVTRQVARGAGRILTLSEFSAGQIVRYLGVSRDRLVLAPPGTPAPAATDDTRRRGPLVLYVGSIFARRHIPELIRAFALVARTRPDARLVLVGDNRTHPPEDPRALATAAGVGPQVEWRAYVEDQDLEGLYRQARVFAFLSDYEGFGMTPFEAIAAGAPPVMLDTPVAREIQGPAAKLVSLDPHAIASAIGTLLDDDAAHAALLGAGRERLARYAWADTATAIQRALEQAVESA